MQDMQSDGHGSQVGSFFIMFKNFPGMHSRQVESVSQIWQSGFVDGHGRDVVFWEVEGNEDKG